ncbi:hypothetical protein DAPPUDRAFT_235915 [Daphnia pulex]|uniref:Uncharacterized protein n=1 Tax=Daphnia pulex TaxID=6669 RepID=E9FZD9_DAPPU|nr:hypothetical protein DAPPUDRAFT_235915 [Daphnia pulex]|eukprot:EFX87279.1 hypothetical protein DAPPUDRAFT_235915 [Daphnia pulex]
MCDDDRSYYSPKPSKTFTGITEYGGKMFERSRVFILDGCIRTIYAQLAARTNEQSPVFQLHPL